MKELSTKTEILYGEGDQAGFILYADCTACLKSWLVIHGTGSGNRVVVVNGSPGAEYDLVGTPRFSPDGSRAVYRAMRKGRGYIVVAGAETQEYEVPGEVFRISRSERPALGRERSWIPCTRAFEPDMFGDAGIAHEEPETDPEPSREIVGGRPFFSPDSSHFAVVFSRGPNRFVVWDGKPGPEYHEVEHLVFSPDGEHLAYAGARDDELFVVVDDNEIPAPGPLAELRLSHGGKHIAWITKSSFREMVVVDGWTGPCFDRIVGLAFTPEGDGLVYLATRDGKLFRVCLETNLSV